MLFMPLQDNTTDILHHVHANRLGMPAVYEHLSSFPFAACPLWHACDTGLPVAKHFPPLVWLQQHPGCTLTTRVEKTSLLHLHSPRGGSSAIGAREAKRARDGGREQREGEVSSTPLRRCDRTSLARKRVSFSHITQEVCCSTLHLLSLYLTYQRSGTVETWCYHTTG